MDFRHFLSPFSFLFFFLFRSVHPVNVRHPIPCQAHPSMLNNLHAITTPSGSFPDITSTPENTMDQPFTATRKKKKKKKPTSPKTEAPNEIAVLPPTFTMPGSYPSLIPSRAPKAVATAVATKTCLYVPVEGDIKILPWKSPPAIGDMLEWQYYEGLSFSSGHLLSQGYRLSGFIRTFGPNSDGVNRRCTKLYVAEINGPVIVVNETRKGGVASLSEKDIPNIFI